MIHQNSLKSYNENQKKADDSGPGQMLLNLA